MTLSDLIRQCPDLTDAQIAYEFNAWPEHFRPVPSKNVLAWMGEAGRLAKLKAFVAANAEATDPQTVVIRSAVETAILAAGNSTTEIDVAPGSLHRQMLEALVQIGVLGADDAASLVARGQVIPDVTEAGVAAVRQAIADQDARDLLTNRVASLSTWILSQPTAPSGDQLKARWEA